MTNFYLQLVRKGREYCSPKIKKKWLIFPMNQKGGVANVVSDNKTSFNVIGNVSISSSACHTNNIFSVNWRSMYKTRIFDKTIGVIIGFYSLTSKIATFPVVFTFSHQSVAMTETIEFYWSQMGVVFSKTNCPNMFSESRMTDSQMSYHVCNRRECESIHVMSTYLLQMELRWFPCTRVRDIWTTTIHPGHIG